MIVKQKILNINFWLSLAIIINIYGLFLQEITKVDSFLFLVPPLLVTIVNWGYKKKIINNFTLTTICFVLFFIPFLQNIIFGISMGRIKYIIYIGFFYLIVPLLNKKSWYWIKGSLILVGVLLNLDALIHIPEILSSGLRIFNIKGLLILDKPIYSMVLTLTISFLLVEIALKKNKYVFLSWSYIGISLFVNIFFLQSKSSILCLITALAVFYLNASRKIRRRIIFLIVFSSMLLFLFSYFFPQYIPEYIKAFFYKVIGNSGNQVYDRYNLTFDHRKIIREFALGLFWKNPILGVGFGNYSFYAIQNLPGFATQTESSFLNVFIEGGVIYGLGYITLNLYLFCELFLKRKKMLRQSGYIYIEMMLMILLIFIFNFQNDYINFCYWILMAIITSYVLYPDKYKMGGYK